MADALILHRLFKHLFSNGTVSLCHCSLLSSPYFLLEDNEETLFFGIMIRGKYRSLLLLPTVLLITFTSVDCKGIFFYHSYPPWRYAYYVLEGVARPALASKILLIVQWWCKGKYDRNTQYPFDIWEVFDCFLLVCHHCYAILTTCL